MPSCVAGALSALSSATRHLNLQVGLVPAALVTLFSLADFFRKSQFLEQRKNLQIGVLALPVFFIMFYPLNIWDDSDWSNLTSRVETGPFKGIYTHPEKKKMIEEIYLSLSPHLTAEGPLLIYPNFSAGYLMSFMPPARGTTWYEKSGQTNAILAKLYQSQLNSGSRVLRMKVYYLTPSIKSFPSFSKEDPLDEFIENTHQLILETEWFTFWAPKPIS